MIICLGAHGPTTHGSVLSREPGPLCRLHPRPAPLRARSLQEERETRFSITGSAAGPRNPGRFTFLVVSQQLLLHKHGLFYIAPKGEAIKSEFSHHHPENRMLLEPMGCEPSAPGGGAEPHTAPTLACVQALRFTSPGQAPGKPGAGQGQAAGAEGCAPSMGRGPWPGLPSAPHFCRGWLVQQPV